MEMKKNNKKVKLEQNKNKIFNELASLCGFIKFDINKKAMYELQYDNIKQENGEVKLFYADADSFIACIKSSETYKVNIKDANTSNNKKIDL